MMRVLALPVNLTLGSPVMADNLQQPARARQAEVVLVMKRVVIAAGLGAGILLAAGQVDAQYRYTDAKGVSKVAQYKLDVPAPYRDAAVWVGPTGIGKPALSEEQRQVKRREAAELERQRRLWRRR
jgi:hypothetical protein